MGVRFPQIRPQRPLKSGWFPASLNLHPFGWFDCHCVRVHVVSLPDDWQATWTRSIPQFRLALKDRPFGRISPFINPFYMIILFIILGEIMQHQAPCMDESGRYVWLNIYTFVIDDYNKRQLVLKPRQSAGIPNQRASFYSSVPPSSLHWQCLCLSLLNDIILPTKRNKMKSKRKQLLVLNPGRYFHLLRGGIASPLSQMIVKNCSSFWSQQNAAQVETKSVFMRWQNTAIQLKLTTVIVQVELGKVEIFNDPFQAETIRLDPEPGAHWHVEMVNKLNWIQRW